MPSRFTKYSLTRECYCSTALWLLVFSATKKSITSAKLSCFLYSISKRNNLLLYHFFFSSRRRHTRYWRDWSSDVCSSDLARAGPAAPSAEAAAPAGKAVYLATSTSDVSAERDRIRRELQQRGYQVLPDRELPLFAPEFVAELRENLARAALSVHLVGASYGLIPEGEEERSVVRLQHELAAERGAAEASFTRLVWVPSGVEPT